MLWVDYLHGKFSENSLFGQNLVTIPKKDSNGFNFRLKRVQNIKWVQMGSNWGSTGFKRDFAQLGSNLGTNGLKLVQMGFKLVLNLVKFNQKGPNAY